MYRYVIYPIRRQAHALLRLILFALLLPFLRETSYGSAPVAGLQSAISAPRGGVVAFRRVNGRLLFHW